MTDRQPSKKPLREVLNVRLDEPLAREIERIASILGSSESEAARRLLQYGIEVQRKLQADELQRPYNYTLSPEKHRFPEIKARWVEYEVDLP